MELKKKEVEIIVDGVTRKFVFDRVNRYAERNQYFLGSELVAIVPHNLVQIINDYYEPIMDSVAGNKWGKCSLTFNKWKEDEAIVHVTTNSKRELSMQVERGSVEVDFGVPLMKKAEDVIDTALKHAELLSSEIFSFCRFVKDKNIDLLKYSMLDIREKVMKLYSGEITSIAHIDGTTIYSGTPNEHNMEKGDEDWYKQHMANQKQAVESCEKVAFWQNPDGSYSADTDLEPGTGLIGYSDSGESDFIVVYGKYPTPIKGQFWYDFQKRINTNFSWYITSRA